MSYADVSKLKDIILKNQYMLTGVTKSIDWGMHTAGIFQAIAEAKTADVAPIRHGEWIRDEEETGVEAFGFKEMTVTGYICSICGASIDVSNGCFCCCPNCGAKMEENE